jgi:hypothetical protein
VGISEKRIQILAYKYYMKNRSSCIIKEKGQLIAVDITVTFEIGFHVLHKEIVSGTLGLRRR